MCKARTRPLKPCRDTFNNAAVLRSRAPNLTSAAIIDYHGSASTYKHIRHLVLRDVRLKTRNMFFGLAGPATIPTVSRTAMSGLEQHILTQGTPSHRNDKQFKLQAPFSTWESAATFHQTAQTEHYGIGTYVAYVAGLTPFLGAKQNYRTQSKRKQWQKLSEHQHHHAANLTIGK